MDNGEQEFGYILKFRRETDRFYGGFKEDRTIVMVEEGTAIFYDDLREANRQAVALEKAGFPVILCARRKATLSVSDRYFAERLINHPDFLGAHRRPN